MGSSISKHKVRRPSSPSLATTIHAAIPIVPQALPALPSDVLIIIFSMIGETAVPSKLRVVSMQFDDLLVPLIYRQFSLNNHVVGCFQQDATERSAVQLQIAKDIRTHTRHVLIDRELHWPSVLQLLYSLKNLQDLTYVMMFHSAFPAPDLSFEEHILGRDWLCQHESSMLTHDPQVSHTGMETPTLSHL